MLTKTDSLPAGGDNTIPRALLDDFLVVRRTLAHPVRRPARRRRRDRIGETLLCTLRDG